MSESKLIIEGMTDAAEIARFRAQDAQHRRNGDWLQAHWADILPQAYGKFLAVAGEEAHIADTPEAAWEWAETAHPQDKGAMVQYVRPPGGPRNYDIRVRLTSRNVAPKPNNKSQPSSMLFWKHEDEAGT